MVKLDLTKEEIIIIKGALGLNSKDEFGNYLENPIIPKVKELQLKLSRAWSMVENRVLDMQNPKDVMTCKIYEGLEMLGFTEKEFGNVFLNFEIKVPFPKKELIITNR